MSSFVIQGGRRLKGEIVPQGAKNEALQIISATLLTADRVVVENIPNIRDVNKLIELVAAIGSKVERLSESSYAFQADDLRLNFMETDEFFKMVTALRGSIMIAGPLLARFGKAFVPQPGGDKIGRRRLDTHFIGFEKLGATVNYDIQKSAFTVTAKELKGDYMLLEEASVTGTANIVMAAVLSKGTTTIFNAACEPYLLQLCEMLNRMGAEISGVG